MKKIIFCMLFCSMSYSGENQISKRIVTVYGTSEISVVPDKMNWFLEVTNRNKSLKNTASEHITIVSRVLRFLKNQGINDTDVQSSAIQLTENWEYKKKGRVKIGYLGSTSINFSIFDFKKYVKIWEGLSEIKGVNVNWTAYDLKDRIAHQNTMREKALLAAKEKAGNLVGTLGNKLGKVMEIEEINKEERGVSIMANTISSYSSGNNSDESAIAPGQVKVKSKIKAVFEIE